MRILHNTMLTIVQKSLLTKVIHSEVESTVNENTQESNHESTVESSHSVTPPYLGQTVPQPSVLPLSGRLPQVNGQPGAGEVEGVHEACGGASCESSAENVVE